MSNKLKELRDSKGLTQKECAEELEMSRDYVSMIERGLRLPGRNAAKKIADYFEITVDELLYNK